MKKNAFLILPLFVLVLSCNTPKNKINGESHAVKVDTLITQTIGGIQQAISISTDDSRKPVLLFLSGGPGSSMMKGSESFTGLLKSRFSIVHWDQRDAGKTLSLNPSPVPPTIDLMVSDTKEVIDLILKRFGQKKLYLLGSSWGNVLGFKIVEKNPELLSAYFAVNSLTNQLESEKDLLARLKEHFKDNVDASKELSAVNIPFKKHEDLFYLRKWLFYMEGKTFVTSESFKTSFLEWSKNWSLVWNEAMAMNLPHNLPKVKCPIYFLVGKNDIQTSTKLTVDYYEMIKAPRKELYMFEHSGHQIHKDEPEKFQNIILQTLN